MFIEIFANFTFLHQNIEVPRKHWMLTILGPVSLCHLQSVLTNLIACMFRAHGTFLSPHTRAKFFVTLRTVRCQGHCRCRKSSKFNTKMASLNGLQTFSGLVVVFIVTDIFGHRPRGTSCNVVSPMLSSKL